MRYDAVVFDNDGVLVEPTDLNVIRSAIREAFNEVGVTDPAEDHVDRLIGVTVEDVEDVADAYGLAPDVLWEARDTAGSEHQSELIRNGGKALFPDVDALTELDVPMGIVSNNQHATVETIVEHYELAQHFEVVYGRQPTLTDIERKKPDPHYLERALEELGIVTERPAGTRADSAPRALYVGDSVKDVNVARAVGVDAAYVRRSHNAHVELPTEPEFEVADLEELVEALE